MSTTPVGTSEIIEVQGHYGVSPLRPDRLWKKNCSAYTVEDARAIIRALSEWNPKEQAWNMPNGWRVAQISVTATVHEGEDVPAPARPRGTVLETVFEVQGLYLRFGSKDERSWRHHSSHPSMAKARSGMRHLAAPASIHGPSDLRIVVVHRVMTIFDQPDVSTLRQHTLPPMPDLTQSSLVFHRRGQPSSYRATWGETGYHVERRPQMGPLPVDVANLRSEAQLVPLFA